MFDILRRFFRKLFRREPSPVVEPEALETKPAQPETELPPEPPPPHKEESPDFEDDLRKAAREKLAQRRARRAKKKPKNEKAETGHRISRQGVRILSKDESFAHLFDLEEDGPGPSVPEASEEPEENFAEMLEDFMSPGHVEIFLEEKKGAFRDEPAPVNEQIKSYPEPEEEIDLHGHTAKEAERKTESFVRTARRNGRRTLRIIVGKGIHSRTKAVLPSIVQQKLAFLKKQGLVLTFRWENSAKRRSGSLIVYLS